MDLRYQLAVVTGAGAPPGRAIAVALGRRGVAVLCADRDPSAAAVTAALVGRARVAAWAVQADTDDELDRRLLMRRADDLGGADLLVVAGGDAGPLTDLFTAGLGGRRGRPDASPAVVRVTGELPGAPTAPPADGPRLMTAVADPAAPDHTALARAVVHLLAHGRSGDVVEAGADQLSP